MDGGAGRRARAASAAEGALLSPAAGRVRRGVRAGSLECAASSRAKAPTGTSRFASLVIAALDAIRFVTIIGCIFIFMTGTLPDWTWRWALAFADLWS